jgi:RING-box protein 1
MEQIVNDQDSKMYKVLKWNAVAMWVYDTISDCCAICKNSLREACITCQGNPEVFDTNQCKKVVGRCNHCFHSHCIENWAKKQNNCPLDSTEWMAEKFLD